MPDQAAPRIWAISAYIVDHDVKFGGYVNGTFASAEQPAGQALEDLVHALATETLSRLHGDPPETMRYDIISVTITPSAEPPMQ